MAAKAPAVEDTHFDQEGLQEPQPSDRKLADRTPDPACRL